jgi:hypothetical protein
MNRTITLTSVEPATLSFRHPLGLNLDLRLALKSQNGTPLDPTPLNPQLIMLPRSLGGIYPYDMLVADAVNGIASVSVPGTALTDVWGYGLELYTRRLNDVPDNPAIPTGLAARGVMLTEGSSYTTSGALGMINVPVVSGPPGPAGMAGPPGGPGQRGSIWTTGSGAPVILGIELTGDMYLDEVSGDVWRFSGAMWTRGSF